MSFETRITLLQAISSGDEVSWQEFYDLYTPLIRLRGGDFGLTQTEAEELVQNVMMNVFQGTESFVYDPEKGKFRNYMRTIIDWRAKDILRKRKKQVSIDEHGEDIATEGSELEEKWDAEWQQHIFDLAVKEVEHCCSKQIYDVFESCVLKNRSPQETAELLDMNVKNVYYSRNKAMKIMKDILSKHEVL